MALGGLTEDESAAGGGAAGLLVAFLFVLGAAFIMGLPRVSIIMFGLAALIGPSVGFGTVFSDMIVWGVVAAALALMSYFGHRELAKAKAAKAGAA